MKPKIVSIETGFPVVLHIPRITAIISPSAAHKRVAFDVSTGQFAQTEASMSRIDLLMEHSYASKSGSLAYASLM